MGFNSGFKGLRNRKKNPAAGWLLNPEASNGTVF